MVVFPNAKINLGLRVKAKRQDGYHELDTVFMPVPLHDVLEVVRQQEDSQQEFTFTQTGLPIPGDLNSNLCFKAYSILKKEHPDLPSIKVHLHKIIPMGAGMGGGSSDGAFMLKMLNEKFNLEMGQSTLKQYALQLGSDCPFFIENTCCSATGRGEILDPITLDLKGKQLILVCPGIHVSTAQAFANIRLSPNATSSKEIVQKPLQEWKGILKNDFEETVFGLHPELKKIKDELYDMGATYAAMSGSGSTLFGIFSDEVPSKKWPEHYQVFIEKF